MKYKTRFLLFFVAMALFHLAANFAHPVTPTIIQELGLPDYMFGLMLAVMMIANFALSPSWGNINRFISSRESLLICCVGYAAAQLGFAYSTTQAGILFVRLLAGVFIGGVFVSMLTYVVNVAEPKDMAKYLTYSATLHSAILSAAWWGNFPSALPFFCKRLLCSSAAFCSGCAVCRMGNAPERCPSRS